MLAWKEKMPKSSACEHISFEKIKFIAESYKLDPYMVMAFIRVESGGNPWVNRYEPGWKWFLNPKHWAKRIKISTRTEWMNQATSWGLMQVMGTVARELGFKGELPKLCLAEIGLEYGCKKLRQLMDKYPHVEDAISSYNQGWPRQDELGHYKNQDYVDKICRYWQKYLGY
jgi:hypothetical protein